MSAPAASSGGATVPNPTPAPVKSWASLAKQNTAPAQASSTAVASQPPSSHHQHHASPSASNTNGNANGNNNGNGSGHGNGNGAPSSRINKKKAAKELQQHQQQQVNSGDHSNAAAASSATPPSATSYATPTSNVNSASAASTAANPYAHIQAPHAAVIPHDVSSIAATQSPAPSSHSHSPAQSTASIASLSNSSSGTSSPMRGKGKKNKNQQHHQQQQLHQQQQHQQQQQAGMAYPPAGFQPPVGGYPPMNMRGGPYPPMPMDAFGNQAFMQFPVGMLPYNTQPPQQGKRHSLTQGAYQPQQGAVSYVPQPYFPPANAGSSTPPIAASAAGGLPYRNQPPPVFAPGFYPQGIPPQGMPPQQFAGQPFGFPQLAYQMNAMNLAGMPNFGQMAIPPQMFAAAPIVGMPITAASSAPAMSAAASSSSSSSSSSSTAAVPPFPTPFATPPFGELLASTQLPQPEQPYFSVDCECVATGVGHNDRALAHVCVVDSNGAVVLNMYIKPTKVVVSYLPALTGLTEEQVSAGITEEEALALFRNTIPSNAKLVGQNILKDVEWLHLIEGQDFDSMLDLAGLFSCRHPTYKSQTFFSLSHEAKALLAIEQKEQHHPAIDAWLSIKLYQLYLALQTNAEEHERSKQLLLALQVEPAFNKKNPVYDGVCMGNKKLCKCGAPWFF